MDRFVKSQNKTVESQKELVDKTKELNSKLDKVIEKWSKIDRLIELLKKEIIVVNVISDGFWDICAIQNLIRTRH